MKTIKVYPTKASALRLEHPTAGKMRADGAMWPKDSFTCRRIKDGAITETAPVTAAPVTAKKS
jgi:hypothetical protein